MGDMIDTSILGGKKKGLKYMVHNDVYATCMTYVLEKSKTAAL